MRCTCGRVASRGPARSTRTSSTGPASRDASRLIASESWLVAHSRSSITTRTGPVRAWALSSSATACTVASTVRSSASSTCEARAAGSPGVATGPPVERRSSGTPSSSSNRSAMPAGSRAPVRGWASPATIARTRSATRSRESPSVMRQALRTTSTSGASPRPSPWRTVRPHSTIVRGVAAARSDSSLASRVLPMPASPTSSATCGDCRATTSSNRACRWPSSASRPRNGASSARPGRSTLDGRRLISS